jgi:DnaJ-class molecular chaperone
MSTNLYAVLQVDRGASHRQITSAYRRLARAYHPDRNPAPDAEERFKAVAQAYAVLSDSARRQAYDQFGDAGLRTSRAPAAAGDDHDADVAFE